VTEATRCPNCGAETTSGQNVCIQCGHDLRRSYRRAPYTRAWIAAGVLAVLAIGVAAGFAIGALTNDKQKKEARQVSVTSSSNSVPEATPVPPQALHQPTAPVTPTPTSTAATTSTPTTPPPSVPPATAAPPSTAPSSPAPSTGGVGKWPAGKSAYTLVLISAKSRKQAYAKAREAKSRGIGAGVLHSNNFSSLNPGYWVVFVGQYKTVGQARSHIGEYASKGFSGGYPRQIKR
jgi:cell division septation protein DedD